MLPACFSGILHHTGAKMLSSNVQWSSDADEWNRNSEASGGTSSQISFYNIEGPAPGSEVQANHLKSNSAFVGTALVPFLLYSSIGFPHSEGKSVFFFLLLVIFFFKL